MKFTAFFQRISAKVKLLVFIGVEIMEKNSIKIGVVGLGYVGMPLAVAFSKHFDVVGFDVNENKISQYKNGMDLTCEVGNEVIQNCDVEFTSDASLLKNVDFVVIAVPTPINGDKTPDLTPVVNASSIVGKNLKKGATVVYESTVYPGVTEDICVPILEKNSGYTCGEDFKVGYSPERINPGDKKHTLRTIQKIVSGMDEDTLHVIEHIYNTVVEAGTYPVSSIKTAEAIKLVENSQRDINIAFMNEMAIVFEKMGIDTNEVVDGMNTKWNALGFRPGLVGGHCISVDPYYFVYEAAKLGYTSQIVSAGRKINDSMGEFVGQMAIKKMIQSHISPADAKVVILGLTFKENCPDTRNSRVLDIIHELKEYGIQCCVIDPWADAESVQSLYGITLCDMASIHDTDCIIHAVSHDCFKDHATIMKMFRARGNRVLIDVKGEWPIRELNALGVTWWRM